MQAFNNTHDAADLIQLGVLAALTALDDRHATTLQRALRAHGKSDAADLIQLVTLAALNSDKCDAADAVPLSALAPLDAGKCDAADLIQRGAVAALDAAKVSATPPAAGLTGCAGPWFTNPFPATSTPSATKFNFKNPAPVFNFTATNTSPTALAFPSFKGGFGTAAGPAPALSFGAAPPALFFGAGFGTATKR